MDSTNQNYFSAVLRMIVSKYVLLSGKYILVYSLSCPEVS